MQGLYAIVNVPDPHGHGVAELTDALLAARCRGGPGASVIQLRAKGASTASRISMLEQMAPACGSADTLLVVNDDVDAAVGSPARGLHLGQDDSGASDLAGLRTRARAAGRGDLIIGLSTHDRAQLVAACGQRPDYVALGPISQTRSKVDAEPVVGFPGLAEGCRLTTRPLVAIGGLNEALGAEAVRLGASAVAVIGTLQHADLSEVAGRAASMAETLARAAAPLSFEAVCAALPVFPPEQLIALARWSDDLGVHIGLGLPARFRPRIVDGVARYRPTDVLDLLFVMDKRPEESWADWEERGGAPPPSLVQLRR